MPHLPYQRFIPPPSSTDLHQPSGPVTFPKKIAIAVLVCLLILIIYFMQT